MMYSLKPTTILIAACLLLSCNSGDSNKSVSSVVVKRDTAPRPQLPANPYASVDLSPMDMAYFPIDYPIQKMSEQAKGLPIARIIYSRPQKEGRKIFGGLLKYGEPWRLGANEATEIEFFRDVTIQNKKIERGRYVLYCIPQPDTWTIVFNSNTFSWGLKPDAKKDLFRFQIPVQHTATPVEYFTMVFEPATNGTNLVMTWDDVAARLPVGFK